MEGEMNGWEYARSICVNKTLDFKNVRLCQVEQKNSTHPVKDN